MSDSEIATGTSPPYETNTLNHYEAEEASIRRVIVDSDLLMMEPSEILMTGIRRSNLYSPRVSSSLAVKLIAETRFRLARIDIVRRLWQEIPMERTLAVSMASYHHVYFREAPCTHLQSESPALFFSPRLKLNSNIQFRPLSIHFPPSGI